MDEEVLGWEQQDSDAAVHVVPGKQCICVYYL